MPSDYSPQTWHCPLCPYRPVVLAFATGSPVSFLGLCSAKFERKQGSRPEMLPLRRSCANDLCTVCLWALVSGQTVRSALGRGKAPYWGVKNTPFLSMVCFETFQQQVILQNERSGHSYLLECPDSKNHLGIEYTTLRLEELLRWSIMT